MAFSVLLTDDAARDLEELYAYYIARHDSPRKANTVIDKLEALCGDLRETPERGAWPKELVALGIKEYRQVFFRSYRIIYRVIGKKVHIMLITDGRRDMRSRLERRLLEAE